MATRRLLVVNPNTNATLTDRMRDVVAGLVAGDTVPVVINPVTGPLSIETAEDRRRVIPTVLDVIRAASDFDGYVLACFDDFAVGEARELVTGPVCSMAEAGIAEAVAGGRRFVIVTTVEASVPGIRTILERYDTAGLGSVRAVGIGVAEATARTENAERALRATIRSALEIDGAEVLLLGSGAFVGRSEELAVLSGVDVIDGLAAAIRLLESGGHLPTAHRQLLPD